MLPYRIYLIDQDGTSHDIHTGGDVSVENGRLVMELEQPGELSFEIRPYNPGYEHVKEDARQYVKVITQTNYVIWTGFIRFVDIRLGKIKYVKCIGSLGYLKDMPIINRKFWHDGNYLTRLTILNGMISDYNNDQENRSFKRFSSGSVIEKTGTTLLKIEKGTFPTYYEALKKITALWKIENGSDPHFYLTHNATTNFINIAYSRYSNRIEVDKTNVIDIKRDSKEYEFFTALMPYGYDDNKNVVTLRSFGDSKDYIAYNRAMPDSSGLNLVERYGLIVKAEQSMFDPVESKAQLMSDYNKHYQSLYDEMLESLQCFTIKMIDNHITDIADNVYVLPCARVDIKFDEFGYIPSGALIRKVSVNLDKPLEITVNTGIQPDNRLSKM